MWKPNTTVEMGRTFCHTDPDIKFPDVIWTELVMTASYVLIPTEKSSTRN